MQTFERVQRADGLVVIDGVEHAVVPDIDRMAPFLMSVVSEGDRWMFVSSSGALAAGRRDASQSLFPYVTDDRLHAAGGETGPVTVLRVQGVTDGSPAWEPFAPSPTPATRRSLAKTVTSDSVVFTEQHERLGLTFSYRWSTAEEFGFVRRATLSNDGGEPVTVAVLDGLVDVLPYGLDPEVLSRFSNLANAYRRSEVVDRASGLAVYTIESPVSDRPEPEEVLRATAVWSFGLDGELTLDPTAIAAARDGGSPPPIQLLTGVPGAHLRRGTVDLAPGASVTWYVVADVALDQVALTELARTVRRDGLEPTLEAATRATGARLTAIVAPADAFQRTGDEAACAHHVSNTIYNVMRGGVPLDGYRLDAGDFTDFVGEHDRRVLARHGDWLADLPRTLERRDLLTRIGGRDDADLWRLADGYLPFSFSRRHGDPSRPWNQFSIRVSGPDGEPIRYYEGNWRDVFQNWEALCTSFPEYLPGIVSTFVNASTPDGHNPYRITRGGIDWEVPDPDDPWANIGYWGDHQVVYLLRLLLAADQFLPGEIERRLGERTCTYADVPYRIAPYDELVRDPKATITFDTVAAERTASRVAEVGADGKLVHGADGDLVRVTLAEKLIVTALAKLSNFVPGGGIWMNTQRPEWNDANNALVGNGLSMVTLFHLRRYLDHLRVLVADGHSFEVTEEVAGWFDAIRAALTGEPVAGSADVAGRRMVDRLGAAGSAHRARVYAGFSGSTTTVTSAAIVELCDRALVHLDETIVDNRRADGLVHSYNLLRLSSDDRELAVEHLPVMLEGQVAALTPGILRASDQADLLDALFASDLFRVDQQTFTLAPPRRPPTFLDKNVIERAAVDDEPLLARLLADGDRTIVRIDADGHVRFAPDATSSATLGKLLDVVASDPAYAPLVAERRDAVHALYEQVFGHHAYLGRSGLMYAYEGIGSIYWHMVTKLLLAVQEAIADAVDREVDGATVDRLVDAYWRVRAGLGFNKSADEFGAVPIDPYSHTPAHAGAQQPGMTGAVKEEILARRRELGVRVRAGRIEFDSVLVRDVEALEDATVWRVATVARDVDVELPAGSLGLTVCQVPIVVSTASVEPAVEIEFADGRVERVSGGRVSAEASAAVFSRTGRITCIRASLA